MTRALLLAFLLSVATTGCQPSDDHPATAAKASADPGASAWGGGTPQETQAATASGATAMLAGWPDAASLDAAKADKGRQLFADKGCVACHNVGKGRKVGPDLAGVTGRDTRDWVQKMILDPEAQIAQDARAKDLLAKYMVKMTNQHATAEEASAIEEFLAGHDLHKQPDVGQSS
jgi:mono/diheme cytochrome c family protein